MTQRVVAAAFVRMPLHVPFLQTTSWWNQMWTRHCCAGSMFFQNARDFFHIPATSLLCCWILLPCGFFLAWFLIIFLFLLSYRQYVFCIICRVRQCISAGKFPQNRPSVCQMHLALPVQESRPAVCQYSLVARQENSFASLAPFFLSSLIVPAISFRFLVFFNTWKIHTNHISWSYS